MIEDMTRAIMPCSGLAQSITRTVGQMVRAAVSHHFLHSKGGGLASRFYSSAIMFASRDHRLTTFSAPTGGFYLDVSQVVWFPLMLMLDCHCKWSGTFWQVKRASIELNLISTCQRTCDNTKARIRLGVLSRMFSSSGPNKRARGNLNP